jgi:molecular chaperone DnaK
MSNMINFGIDLGTTNSLVAKFNKGTVEIYKNPNGFKETLPSIVGFRNDRIMVGEQAKTFAEKDPKSVASRFKRKMAPRRLLRLSPSMLPKLQSSFQLLSSKNSRHSFTLAKFRNPL